MFKYARKNISKWLNNNIQLHFIMKHFNMTQWCLRFLTKTRYINPLLLMTCFCPHNHLLKTTTITGDIRELTSPLVDQSARCPVRELAIRELAYPRVVQLPLTVVGHSSPDNRLPGQTPHKHLSPSWDSPPSNVYHSLFTVIFAFV